MKMFLKVFIAAVLSLGIVATSLSYTGSMKEIKAGDEPVYVMACLSDLHNQAEIITEPGHAIRGSITKTIDDMCDQEPYVDAIVISGDLSSNVETTEDLLYTIHDKVEAKANELTDKTFWTTGNHDFNAAGENPTYNSADYYDRYVKTSGLGPVASEDDIYIETYNGVDYVCGYRYDMGECEVICLLDPLNVLAGGLQNSNNKFTDGTLDWLDDTLWRVSEDEYKPIFVIGHFPFTDCNSTTSSKGMLADCQARMKDIFANYADRPNLYYLFGHDHGGDDAYILTDTEQRVTEYDRDGNVLNPWGKSFERADDENIAFRTIFMGSMRYYNNKYDTSSNYIGARTPLVIQALMVYVYNDRIEFVMKNYGEVIPGNEELEPYVVMRRIKPTPEPTEVPAPTPEPKADNPAPSNDPVNNPAVNNPVNNPSNNPAGDNKGTAPETVSLKKAAVSRFKVGKNGKNAEVTIKKLSGAEGYQVQIGSDKKFKKVIYKKNTKSLKLKVKKLKKYKKYYIRVRGYATDVNGKSQYGAWSSVKKS